MHSTTRRAGAYGAAALAAALAIAATPAQADTPPPAAGTPGAYIVTLADKPLITYEGGVPGIAATRPGKAGKADTTSANAKRYQGYLKDKHAKTAQSVGARPVESFSVAANGFTADLTPAQVVKLLATDGVVSVVPDRLQKALDDHRSTDFLGLSGETGLWSRLGGTAKAGNGVVVGVIDTGIWPENPSFAGPPLGAEGPTAEEPYRPYRQGSTTVMKKADGGTFTGVCQTGDEFTADLCNQKVISARYFGDAWMRGVPPEKRADYVSPRDAQGHGSHTASTAAGNTAVKATAAGIDFGEISGVAPGAAIAVYKALWQGKDDHSTGGALSDILAAIDQAVADGVDVINYSVGGMWESAHDDPVMLAFGNAAAAGIFVAAAGGNSGPTASSLDNTPPWVTTVAASTLASYSAELELGDGTRYQGVSTTVSAPFGPKPLASAVSVKNATASDSDANNCAPGTLDPAKATGKIIICQRGVIGRTVKSSEVKRAGGVGVVMANPSDQDMSGDVHAVPTVHINWPDTQAVLDYAATPGATATLLPSTAKSAPYPQVAPFSSRGPSEVTKGDLLKPDIAAPGVSILAAVAPPGNDGKDFDFLSGTSMAAPHIAGLAALYLGEHPDWSPMWIKSAMMTTAFDTKKADGTPSTDVFAQGAGQVDATRMLDPGLVYDAGPQDWLGYLEGLGVRTGSGVAPVAARDLNYPSIAIGELFGTATITRRVTAVTPGVYHAKAELPGMKVKVSPPTLHFKQPGETKEFTITADMRDTESGVTVTGSLTWTGAGRTVRSPIVATPLAAVAPAQVQGSGASGSVSFDVTPATKKFPIEVYGMASAAPTAGSVSQNDIWGTDIPVEVPAGTKAVQFTARPENPDARLTMLVSRFRGGAWDIEYISEIQTADATISVATPEPGTYHMVVLTLEDLPGTTATPFTVQANVVGGGKGKGGLTLTPKKPKVTPGQPVTLTATWSGLSGARHTGFVEYPNGTGTVVSVN
ncbi:S8 family serine peptidase [Microtetraspora niveoalba]|uniref:S8 family serine peptidase n=1 Tax=Microtetraspora niveoalba TaxID=46175 RepID=UPI000830A57A|nr:S8 family serine peptidase [Microtetraspora niveoalba]